MVDLRHGQEPQVGGGCSMCGFCTLCRGFSFSSSRTLSCLSSLCWANLYSSYSLERIPSEVAPGPDVQLVSGGRHVLPQWVHVQLDCSMQGQIKSNLHCSCRKLSGGTLKLELKSPIGWIYLKTYHNFMVLV